MFYPFINKVFIILFFATIFISFDKVQHNDFAAKLFFCDNKLDKNTHNYYTHIRLAEKAIWQNKYIDANSEYKLAFSAKSNPFYYDLLNAIIVATKCNDSTAVKNLIKKSIISKGIRPEFFENLSAFDEVTSMNLWKEIKSQSQSYLSLFNKNSNNKLREELKELFDKDQAVREKNYYTDLNRLEIKKRIRIVDSLNIIKFVDLIKTYGFPVEEKIGIYSDTITGVAFPLYDALIIHFCQAGWYNSIDSILENSLFRGELFNSLYAKYADINYIITNDTNYYHQLTVVQSYEINLYRPFINYKLMPLINKNRMSIGMDSFQVSQRKFLCKMYNASPYYFEPHTTMEIIPSGLFRNDNSSIPYIIKSEKEIEKCPL